MPKAKWGAGDKALSAGDIDGAERSETRKRYSGELPRGGTYRFVIQSIKKDVSAAGNDKALIFSTLDGSWKPNHAQYDGCPVWDHLPVHVTDRLANFLDAVGATGKDFVDGVIVDENGYFTKLGRVGDPKGLLVYINVKKDKGDGSYDPSLKVDFNGYMPVDEDDDSAPAAGADDDGAEPPF